MLDEAVLDVANRDEALLLAADKDFGELVHRQRRLALGIVLVRLAGMPPAGKADLVLSAVSRYGSELPGSFAVVTAEAVRLRSGADGPVAHRPPVPPSQGTPPGCAAENQKPAKGEGGHPGVRSPTAHSSADPDNFHAQSAGRIPDFGVAGHHRCPEFPSQA